jgi:phosphocarrier protein HPr
MNQEQSQDLMIVNELGLHARSAARIAQLARKAEGGVWLEKNNDRADAKQVIDLLMLAAAKGDHVRISIDNLNDHETLNQIARLIKDGFGE